MFTKKKMYQLVVVVIAFIGLIAVIIGLYAYRWNLVNPLKKATLTIGNFERTFVYHVPRQVSSHPKLIIAYHGTGMWASLMQVFTGHEFDEQADMTKDAIIVYPQGYESNWNDCRKTAPYPAKQLQIDDVGFTEQIIAFFSNGYQIDKKEVYAVGFSNGGTMVMKLARQHPEWFKGFAVIGSNMPAASNDDCEDIGQPVSMLFVSGENDPIVPYQGGEIILDGKNFGLVKSVEETVAHWLTISQCLSDKYKSSSFPNTNPTVFRKDYMAPVTEKRICFIRIANGGHTISNRNFRIPIKKMGYMNTDVDVPVLIWEFFMSLK
ncbi:alpha/beta hydrolase family esterase [Xanthocytophaga flava]|uniref:alpha/beta hydrolase family esterase n=1 Tax=Xanthocytophaga flava TaxID=3048013 RepID=UPI0028D67060|nr:prolyl oligopeptidase family serine peptidase [Xanthocytophaga flavus]MDJ1468394.1 prolyl oligopeptidase family serine peptidase [Xanthocytophaga flavus]